MLIHCLKTFQKHVLAYYFFFAMEPDLEHCVFYCENWGWEHYALVKRHKTLDKIQKWWKCKYFMGL